MTTTLQDSMLAKARAALRDAGPGAANKYWYPLTRVTYGEREIEAAIEVLCSFRTTMGERTKAFERQFAESQGFTESVMVNSGSSADLLIAFALVNPRAKLLQPGDEVLVPSVTWPTQIWSLMMAGLNVRFVDVDPRTLNIDPDDVERRITPKTRAISVVHLMGNPCDMDRLAQICRKHNLLMVEDCCESLGTKWNGQSVGTFGLAGAFSFFFSHHITTMEGGMIGCRDGALSDLFRLLRAHGWGRDARHSEVAKAAGVDPRYTFVNLGFNVRPMEIQAAFGLEQLGRLDAFNAQRTRNAAYFAKAVARHKNVLSLMEVDPRGTCSWFALPMLVAADSPFTRQELVTFLEREGVETRPVVAGNLARQPVCLDYPTLQGADLPGADAVHERGFYLGLHPVDATKDLDRLAELFDGFIRTHG